MLWVNEQQLEYREGLRVADLVAECKPGADLFIVNGYPVSSDTLLYDNDGCCLIKRGEVPAAEEMQSLLVARHTPGVHAQVKRATVGIMGLGGLGSSVAVALARIGVGRLLLADFDMVEPSNLNRQQYFVEQIGLKKTVALKENITRINPYVRVESVDERLTEENIPLYFKEVDVLAECFDDPAMKACALRAFRMRMAALGYVCASGMAGYGDNNTIATREIFPQIFLVGDGMSESGPGQGLMAPRVGIVAHHQANQIVRIILAANDLAAAAKG
jgi:sulfur carrier protein ThiS adenylyltransferase